MEEAAWARSWGQEDPQTALQQETPGLGGCRDTRVALGLPARPSRKSSGVFLCACSQCRGQRRAQLPRAPAVTTPRWWAGAGAGVAGGRGGVSMNSTTASVLPEGWGVILRQHLWLLRGGGCPAGIGDLGGCNSAH